MDPSWLALVAFLLGTVVVAAVMLWPRFRDAMGARDPVVPEVVEELRARLAEEAVGASLVEALDRDPLQVRAERAHWREELRRQGATDALLRALDRL